MFTPCVAGIFEKYTEIQHANLKKIIQHRLDTKIFGHLLQDEQDYGRTKYIC